MNRYLFVVLMVSTIGYGQQNEFKTYSNGLIYDQSTMNRLELIVDSLNVKFRTCDLSHPYYSFDQGYGNFVGVPSREARELIKSGIGFEEYARKFPDAVTHKKVWIMKIPYMNYQRKKMLEYSGLPYGWSSEPSLSVRDQKKNDKQTGWIFSEDEDEAVFLEKLTPYEIPQSYSRLVQYVDCMIDTTAQIYLPAASSEVYQQVEKGSKSAQFIAWAGEFPKKPEYPDYNKLNQDEFEKAYASFNKKYDAWDSLRLANLDRQMKVSAYHRKLLEEATEEALTDGNTDSRLEFYVARYISKEDALCLKRSRKVVGNCSQDQSPRYHAMEICQLAAETAHWDIFLRSHLDIMNDRFERMSDGSYAWAGRKTYLKELEELDIEAVDLLLGTAFRVQNVSHNHYWGSIDRVGRALEDTPDKNALEARLFSIVDDNKLDPYNRLLIAYLISHYAHNLDDEQRQKECLESLQTSIKAMPESIQQVWPKESDR